jgi:hypothetical protein
VLFLEDLKVRSFSSSTLTCALADAPLLSHAQFGRGEYVVLRSTIPFPAVPLTFLPPSSSLLLQQRLPPLLPLVSHFFSRSFSIDSALTVSPFHSNYSTKPILGGIDMPADINKGSGVGVVML